MDWEIKSDLVDVAIFGDFTPNEILYEFDGPRIFSVKSSIGMLLCFLADDDGKFLRFIAAPTNDDTLTKLQSGIRPLRDALDQPWIWFVDCGYDGVPKAAWRGTLSDAPADTLPDKGVMLWPHLEPIFALRAIGEGLREGSVPMSVIRQVIDGATMSLKKIANSVFEEAKGQGRKANTLRQFYDLPAIGFAYNSFEVALRLPDIKQGSLLVEDSDENDAAFSKMGQKLEKALDWAIDGKDSESPSIEMLEALEKLIPPRAGIVKSIEIRGRIFSGARNRYELTRDSSAFVRKALVTARAFQERISTVSGSVREFDKDDFSFTLRDTTDGKDHVCIFQPEFYDDLFDVFNTDESITISGRENLKTNKIDVSLVSRDRVEES